MKKNIIITTIYLLFTGCTLTPLVAKGSINGKITILEQKNLYFPDKRGIPFEGLSDLSYDKKRHMLYMIGDRGYLYSFYAKFNKKIEKLNYLNAFHIKAPNNKTIHPDIEGLTHNSKGQLISSFEREPRVKQITTNGRLKSNYKIPKKLRKRSIYKSRNKMFEGVAYHKKYGILVAVEYPINRKKNTRQTIYSLKGKEWHFRAESYKNSAVTAIEVMDDGNILVLERAYSGLSNPMYITLKKVYLNRCDKRNHCKSEVLSRFSSADNWGYVNFEGLAKVGKNRFVMVSDNNGHLFLPTVLTYFKVN
jgi:uncharacterized protein YjiK